MVQQQYNARNINTVLCLIYSVSAGPTLQLLTCKFNSTFTPSTSSRARPVASGRVLLKSVFCSWLSDSGGQLERSGPKTNPHSSTFLLVHIHKLRARHVCSAFKCQIKANKKLYSGFCHRSPDTKIVWVFITDAKRQQIHMAEVTLEIYKQETFMVNKKYPQIICFCGILSGISTSLSGHKSRYVEKI